MSSPNSKRRIQKRPGRAAHGSLHRHCSPRTFECVWCKDAGLTPEEYTRPIRDIGGQSNDPKGPICDDCADAAAQESDQRPIAQGEPLA